MKNTRELKNFMNILSLKNSNIAKPIASIFDFAFFADFYKTLDSLESLAMPEKWCPSSVPAERTNKKNPILESYFHHTFKRLWSEYCKAETDDQRQKIIYFDGNIACFNTGLFTANYSPIYAYFRRAVKETDRRPFSFYSFEDASSNYLSSVSCLPRRANYFSDIRELIYDANLELRANVNHILDENISRFPPDLSSNKAMLLILFTGAIDIAKKRVQANYKVAVPTYYRDEICLMLPLCLRDSEKTDLALAVVRKEGFYVAKTCLTLDMAYNDARLIAKPDNEWLTP